MRVRTLRRILFVLALVLASTAAREAAARPPCWISGQDYFCGTAPQICFRTTVTCRLGPFTGSTTSTECEFYYAGSIEETACTPVSNSNRVVYSYALRSDIEKAYAVNPPCLAYPLLETFDFPNDAVKGAVPAHRHPNGCGIVANSAYVEPGAYVDLSAQVFGHPVVLGGVRVEADARVGGGTIKGCYRVWAGKPVMSGLYEAACP
jgi:hypothetical protein